MDNRPISHVMLVLLVSIFFGLLIARFSSPAKADKGDQTPWCLKFNIDYDDTNHSALGCVDSEAFCKRVRSVANEYKGAIGISYISSCEMR